MSADRPSYPISIWQPQQRDGETVWVRPPPGPFGDHYANRIELKRKRAELPLRVVLFGESVAAGYLYAPQLTPAAVLEAQLRAIGGAGNFEVIDLARTNETLSGLQASVRASLLIYPDVCVLWVGNHWNLLETPALSAYAADPAARQAPDQNPRAGRSDDGRVLKRQHIAQQRLQQPGDIGFLVFGQAFDQFRQRAPAIEQIEDAHQLGERKRRSDAAAARVADQQPAIGQGTDLDAVDAPQTTARRQRQRAPPRRRAHKSVLLRILNSW